MSLKSIARLYQREYPALIHKIERLRTSVRARNPNCALIALFGSAARFEPRAASDVDLLVLTHRREDAVGVLTQMSQLVADVEDWSDAAACAWPISVVVSDASASDLDESFLAGVARDGVLVYLQEGACVPGPLAGLRPYDDWLREVEAELAECRAVLALPSAQGRAGGRQVGAASRSRAS